MRIEITQDAAGEFRWRFRNKGRITASAESFPTKDHAARAAKAVVVAVAKQLGITRRNIRFLPQRMTGAGGFLTMIEWEHS